jgi:hypothetical protein
MRVFTVPRSIARSSEKKLLKMFIRLAPDRLPIAPLFQRGIVDRRVPSLQTANRIPSGDERKSP